MRARTVSVGDYVMLPLVGAPCVALDGTLPKTILGSAVLPLSSSASVLVRISHLL